MQKRREPELRSETMHIRVRHETKDAVAEFAVAEKRKMSDMGSILLEEAVATRSRRKRR